MNSLSNDNDEQLFALLSRDSKEAFAVLYERYRDKLYSYAYRLSRSEEVAMDLVHEVFLKLWEKRRNLEDRQIFASYLYTMIKNFRINQLQRISKERLIHNALTADHVAESDTPEAATLTRELAEKIKEAVAQLPERQRQVYQLHREAGLPHADIAHRLNLSRSTVENHLNRAVQNIRHYLSRHYPEIVIYTIVLGAAWHE